MQESPKDTNLTTSMVCIAAIAWFAKFWSTTTSERCLGTNETGDGQASDSVIAGFVKLNERLRFIQSV